MDRERLVVSDIVWEKIEALLPGKKSDRGVTAKDNRLFLEAVLWRVRAGLPWRDLPAEFGNPNTVFKRFRRWVRDSVFDRIFKAYPANRRIRNDRWDDRHRPSKGERRERGR